MTFACQRCEIRGTSSPKHDAVGHHYILWTCPNCGTKLGRLVPDYDGGRDLREELRGQATLEDGVHDVTVQPLDGEEGASA